MKKIGNILFLYFFVFIMCMGGSFAWYVWKGSEVSVNVNFANLDPYIEYIPLTIKDSDKNKTLTESDDYTGGIGYNLVFNKKANGDNLDAYGQNYLKVTSATDSNIFKASNFKWTLVSVSNNVREEISTGNFVGENVVESDDVSKMIPISIDFSLTKERDNTSYEFYLWLDKNSYKNINISGENITVSIVPTANTIKKNDEMYIRSIEYGTGVINKFVAYYSYSDENDKIIAYKIVNTETMPDAGDSDWTVLTSSNSVEEAATIESGKIVTIEPNYDMKEVNNICIKNTKNKVYCKSIGKYSDSAGDKPTKDSLKKLCNDLTYNGNPQQLVSSTGGDGYVLKSSTDYIGKNAGKYTIVASLKDNYVWKDGTSDDVDFDCSIEKQDLTVKALDQTITYGESISLSKYTYDGIVEGDMLASVNLIPSTSEVTDNGTITPEVGIIMNDDGEDLVDNYNIIYVKGKLVIKDKVYQLYDSSGNSTGYAYSLSNAISKVKSGGTIKALKSNDGGNVTISKNLTLDLNNFTVSSSVIEISSGTTIVRNGTVKSTSNYVFLVSGGNLKVTTGAIISGLSDNTSISGAIGMSSGNINIDDGNFDGNMGIIAWGGSIDIKGGTITGGSGKGIYLEEDCNLTMSGGIVKSKISDGVKHSGTGTINVTGGSIFAGTDSSSVGIWMQGGGVVNIGTKDGKVNVDSPKIYSNSAAALEIENGTWNFYDGSLYGPTVRNDYSSTESGYFAKSVVDSTYGYKTYLIYDATPPALALSKKTYQEGFKDWTLNSASVSNNILSMTEVSSSAHSDYYMVDGGNWYVTYDGYTTSSAPNHDSTVGSAGSGDGGILLDSYYYGSDYSEYTSSNGYSGNGNAPQLPLNTWSNGFVWDGYSGFGSKFLKINYYTGGYYSSPTVKIRNFKVYGEKMYAPFYLIDVTASDNNGVAKLKYAAGSQNASYFANNGSNVENNQIKVTSNGDYTVYAEDAAGNSTVKTINIDRVDGDAPNITNVYSGKMLYTDPEFSSGVNSTQVYNNLYNGAVTVTRKQISGIPNSSGYGLEIVTSGSAAPGLGGFYFATSSGMNKEFITRIVAKIPVGYTIEWGTNSVGDGYTSEWLTSQAGTGDWSEYVFRIKCGSSGTFSTTNFFYLTGGSTVTWQVAYATVIDTTVGDSTNYILTVANDSLSGIVGYAYTTTNSRPSSWNKVINNKYASSVYPTTSNGTYYVWYKDAAGNVSSKAVDVKFFILDLNGYLDGAESGNITGYGTADVYVNGNLVCDDCTDYYEQYPYGSTYEIKDIKQSTGHTYNGVYTGNGLYTGNLSGTLTSGIGVYLNFTTNSYTVTSYYYYYYEDTTSWTHFDTRTDTITYGSSFAPYNVDAPSGYYAGNNYGYYDSSYNYIGAGTVGSDSFTVTGDMIVHVHYYQYYYQLFNSSGSTTGYANSLRSSIDNVLSGGTIKMLLNGTETWSDYTTNETSNKSYTLDTNGKTLNVCSWNITGGSSYSVNLIGNGTLRCDVSDRGVVSNSVTLTIKGPTIEAISNASVWTYDHLNFIDGNIISPSGKFAIAIMEGGSLEMTGGTITGYGGIHVWNDVYYNGTAGKCHVLGGTISTTNRGIQSDSTNAYVYITGASVTSSDSDAVYVGGYFYMSGTKGEPKLMTTAPDTSKTVAIRFATSTKGAPDADPLDIYLAASLSSNYAVIYDPRDSGRIWLYGSVVNLSKTQIVKKNGNVFDGSTSTAKFSYNNWS